METLKMLIRKGTLDLSFVSVLTGTAFKNKGVQPLLGTVVNYLPSPLDAKVIKSIHEDYEVEIVWPSSDAKPFLALVGDLFVVSITFAHFYSGVVEVGTSVYNSIKGKNEHISRMMETHVNDHSEINPVITGDITALVGLNDTTTSKTLCDRSNTVLLEMMDFTEPVIKVVVEPKMKANQQKVSEDQGCGEAAS